MSNFDVINFLYKNIIPHSKFVIRCYTYERRKKNERVLQLVGFPIPSGQDLILLTSHRRCLGNLPYWWSHREQELVALGVGHSLGCGWSDFWLDFRFGLQHRIQPHFLVQRITTKIPFSVS